MTNGADTETSALGQCLRRLESLIESLDRVQDANARSAARALLETALDLHGLALARILTICQGFENGDDVIRSLIDDEYVAAIALLHGLHPQEAEARLRRKIATMRPHWGVRGFRVDLISVDRTSARVRVDFADDDARQNEGGLKLKRELEDLFAEAAPDLDSVVIDGLDEASAPAQVSKHEALQNFIEIGADQHERRSA